MAMLDTVKGALRLTVNNYDTEITGLIAAAKADIGLVGIDITDADTDALLTQAIITFCRVHFGSPDDYDRLKASYDEQKAQLLTATGYGFPVNVPNYLPEVL